MDRFFFEIVQRLDGYDGYGGLNAEARMASQAGGDRKPEQKKETVSPARPQRRTIFLVGA
jgi:4-hydroxyphenylpyruvate dioxygenase-like putative hemolysin